MLQRKFNEIKYHNYVRREKLKKDKQTYEYFWSNRKFYSIDQYRKDYVEQWMLPKIKNKNVLDYCCGNGSMAIWMIKHKAAQATGIDLSDVSIDNAYMAAEKDGLHHKCKFQVMDAEKMEFPNGSFDIIYERGALHHLDLSKAYSEIARVMKPNGFCICIEALKHNPLIHYYRRKTPQLRTPWEIDHILGKKEIESAKKYFNKVEILGFFYLVSLFAVPFKNTKVFNPIFKILNDIDNIILSLPYIRWQAWQIVFTLSEPTCL